MEPASAAENEVASESLLKLFLHCSRLQEQRNEEGLDVGLDKIWEGQWPFQLKDWANSSMQICDSPLASDSSSSRSTRDSSIFSWSESSYNAAKPMLRSPEPLSSRFSGFSLFNSGVNHMEWPCRDSFSSELSASKQDGYALHKASMLCRLVESGKSTCDGSIGNLRPVEFGFDRDDFNKSGQSNEVTEHLDGDWVSDTSDSGSLTSSSSQELQRSNFCNEDDDTGCDILHNELHCSVLTSSSQFHTERILVQADIGHSKPVQRLLNLTDELYANDMGINQNKKITATCNGASYAYSYKDIALNAGECASCFFKNNGRECACSAKVSTHSSPMAVEKLYLAAPCQQLKSSCLDECRKGYGIQGVGEYAKADSVARPPHGSHKHLLPNSLNTVVSDFPQSGDGRELDERRKGYGIQGVGDSAKVDSVVRPSRGSHRHSLPNSLNTVVPNSLQSGEGREPFSHRKASYSAAVKERFASSTMHGYLRFAEQGGSPCYSFFLDDSDEVLFARASRQERKSNKENCEWTYSFHSKKDNGKARGAWKSWPKKENLASDLVANMRVSVLCHLKGNSNQDGHAKEARFVLYDGGGQHQIQSPRAGYSNKMRGQPLKPVFDNTSSSHVGLIKEGTKTCLTNPDAKAGAVKTARLPNASTNRNNASDAGKKESGFQDFSKGKLKPIHSQQAELAAIVISTTLKEKKIKKKKESLVAQEEAAGWGIKFLEKGSQSGWGLSFMERSSSCSRGLDDMAPCRASASQGPLDCLMGDSQGRPNNEKDDKVPGRSDVTQKLAKRVNTRKNRLKVDVTVILPAGVHGLPDYDEDNAGGLPQQYGPTPLLERWMSGGDCECGGWDMGCGLSVFKAETLSLSRRTSNIALTRNDRINWLSPGNPFKLLTQGYGRKKVLVLEIIEAGLFSLSFQARVSPLQAFAIAVALFHQQMTDK